MYDGICEEKQEDKSIRIEGMIYADSKLKLFILIIILNHTEFVFFEMNQSD